MLKSLFAIVIAFVLWGGLWVGSNTLLQRLLPGSIGEDGSVSNSAVLVWLLVLSVLISLITGYLVARMTDGNAIWHGGVLGIVLLLFGAFVQSQVWNVLPLWYHLLFLGLLIPAALAGSWLQR